MIDFKHKITYCKLKQIELIINIEVFQIDNLLNFLGNKAIEKISYFMTNKKTNLDL
ncbi:protein of unknown function [Legionella fallonii LLAP-10]|uniref:Uncharacterized protein n=1 Tax=Legionella fallonii LLAP-10 TaxID=1212491 RepID=A0A098G201_9GAMM|nr:protein of unknown function [Legionella fallonii LLAP-10]